MNEQMKIDYQQIQLPLTSGVVLLEKNRLSLPDTLSRDDWVKSGWFLSEMGKSIDLWFADWLAFGKQHFEKEFVQETIARLELKIQDVRRSLTLEGLGFRHPELGPAHHYVLARSKLDPVGVKMWADLAHKEDLSGAELQESIKKGHVVHIKQEDRAVAAGVSTWQGLATQFDLLRRQIGDEWLTWTPQNIDNVLEKLIKIRGFVTQLLERKLEMEKGTGNNE